MSDFHTVEENHTVDKLANSINYTFIFHGAPCHVVVSSLQCWQIVCKNPSSILRPQWAAESPLPSANLIACPPHGSVNNHFIPLHKVGWGAVMRRDCLWRPWGSWEGAEAGKSPDQGPLLGVGPPPQPEAPDLHQTPGNADSPPRTNNECCKYLSNIDIFNIS